MSLVFARNRGTLVVELVCATLHGHMIAGMAKQRGNWGHTGWTITAWHPALGRADPHASVCTNCAWTRRYLSHDIEALPRTMYVPVHETPPP
eukprot:363337-Chlamydomonas_euryale.AAC.11